jgi:malonate transporter MadM subunit
VLGSFAVGAGVAWVFGYTDPISMTTIGAGAATDIVGPVTGTAIAATSDVAALSIAAGLVKSMLVMTATFYTGLGCLVGPSVVFVTIRALFGS